MKSVLRLVVLLVAIGCFAVVVAYSHKPREVITTGPDAEALMQVERDLGRAWNRLDIRIIEGILAEEASITGVRGGRATKAEVIAQLKPSVSSTTAPGVILEYEKTEARFYGDVGILTGTLVWKKSDSQDRWSFTDTFVKRDGRWQVVAAHRTRITKN